MTVEQLIELLKGFPKDLPVCRDAGGSSDGEPAEIERAEIGKNFFVEQYTVTEESGRLVCAFRDVLLGDGVCLWLW